MISEPFEFAQLIVLILTIVFLLLAVEYKKLSFAVIAFAVGNGFLSLAFFALGAPYVAVFNFSVFSGAVAILFLAAMSLDTPADEDEMGTETDEEATDQ
jgi:NADH:ubiquinone oxidoreductase subunit 6 (subunit J)